MTSNLIMVGIKNINNDRIKTINSVFEYINYKIQNRKNFKYAIQIENYESLKSKFSEERIKLFEAQEKAVTEFIQNIILFNDSFFKCSEINQQSVFLHEIGHIAHKPRQLFINFNNPIIERIYIEYLADKFLFEIDKDIFNIGRVEADINTMNINEGIQNNIDKEAIVKGKFIVVGRLYYYYNFYNYKSILVKINDLITLIKEYFQNIDHILHKLKNLHIEFESKSDKELIELLDKIDLDIRKLT